MNKQQEKDLAKIQEREKNGVVCFITFEGVMGANLDEFIKQPAEGILYDLIRDKVTTLSLADKSEIMRIWWINDYAVAVVIEKLKSEIDRLSKANDHK